VKSLFIKNKESSLGTAKRKKMFVSELTNALGNIDVINLTSIELLKNTIQEYIRISNSSWHKFFKNVDITKYSKA